MLKVTIESERGVKKELWMPRLIRKAAAAALAEENIESHAELSVLLTDNEGIRTINKDYRQKDTATDVLSFPANELVKPLAEAMAEGFEPDRDVKTGRLFLGDIAISLERAAAQAEEYRHTFKREIAFLTIHAMLHLMGYDHETEPQEAVMREKQRIILQKLMILR